MQCYQFDPEHEFDFGELIVKTLDREVVPKVSSYSYQMRANCEKISEKVKVDPNDPDPTARKKGDPDAPKAYNAYLGHDRLHENYWDRGIDTTSEITDPQVRDSYKNVPQLDTTYDGNNNPYHDQDCAGQFRANHSISEYFDAPLRQRQEVVRGTWYNCDGAWRDPEWFPFLVMEAKSAGFHDWEISKIVLTSLRGLNMQSPTLLLMMEPGEFKLGRVHSVAGETYNKNRIKVDVTTTPMPFKSTGVFTDNAILYFPPVMQLVICAMQEIKRTYPVYKQCKADILVKNKNIVQNSHPASTQKPQCVGLYRHEEVIKCQVPKPVVKDGKGTGGKGTGKKIYGVKGQYTYKAMLKNKRITWPLHGPGKDVQAGLFNSEPIICSPENMLVDAKEVKVTKKRK